jgi:hypothetical protein
MAALASPDDHLVGLACDEVSCGFQVGEDALPRGVPLETCVVAAEMWPASSIASTKGRSWRWPVA